MPSTAVRLALHAPVLDPAKKLRARVNPDVLIRNDDTQWLLRGSAPAQCAAPRLQSPNIPASRRHRSG